MRICFHGDPGHRIKVICLLHKFGRWKLAGCELPPFNATQFLELVKGKSMAFVGGSMARNQMQSLLCLLVTFSLPQTILEMAVVEKLLHIPEDSVPYKIHAK